MPEPLEQREDKAHRALIIRVQEEIRVINATLNEFKQTIRELVIGFHALREDNAGLNVRSEHSLTWGKVIASGLVVLTLVLTIVWRGVDRAEAARDKMLDAKAAFELRAAEVEATCNKLKADEFNNRTQPKPERRR